MTSREAITRGRRRAARERPRIVCGVYDRYMIVTMGGGEQILIRPIEPGDQAALASGMERLSLESRYRRFFVPMSKLGERDLAYLTEVDHHGHEALVAIDERTGVGIGVARYVRTDDGVAEPALVVIDEWQGRGVGTALLSALVERALAERIVRFEAPVLATNAPAIRVLERIGETARSQDGTKVTLSIELPNGPPPSPGPERVAGEPPTSIRRMHT